MTPCFSNILRIQPSLKDSKAPNVCYSPKLFTNHFLLGTSEKPRASAEDWKGAARERGWHKLKRVCLGPSKQVIKESFWPDGNWMDQPTITMQELLKLLWGGVEVESMSLESHYCGDSSAAESSAMV